MGTVVTQPQRTGVNDAAFVRDASGNITGLAGANGRVYPLDSTTGATTVLFGDSRTNYNNNSFAGITLTRSNNVVTCAQAAHGLHSGLKMKVTNAGDTSFNTTYSASTGSGWVTLTRVDANNFSYPSVGADGSTTGNTTFREKLDERGWFNWFNAMCGMPFDVVYNAGTSSDKIADMLARVTTDLAPYNPAWCFLNPGFNDAVNGTAIATIRTGLASLMAQCKQYCGQLVLVTPWTVAAATPPTAAINWRLQVIRQMIFDYARANPGVQVWDAYAATIDPVNATRGSALANYMFDNSHQSALGAFQIAQQGFRDVKVPVGLRNNNRPLVAGNAMSSAASSGASGYDSVGVNLWDNGIWTASGGTVTVVTGTAASGIECVITAGASGVASVVARGNSFACPASMLPASPYVYTNGWQRPMTVNIAGGTVSDISYSRDGGTTLVSMATATGYTITVNPGDSLKITYTVAPTVTFIPTGVPDGMGYDQHCWFKAAANNDFGSIRTVSGSSMHSQITAGGSYYLEFDVGFLNVANAKVKTFGAQIKATFDGTAYNTDDFVVQNNTSYWASDWEGIVRTPTFTVPNFSTCTNFQWSVALGFSASSAQGVLMRVGRIGVFRVS